MPDDVGPAEAEVSGAVSESDNEYDETEVTTKDDDDEKMAERSVASEGVETNGDQKKKYDPKDPLRPRRKKARRACYACQRAHLTCGDERPCQRCIKRGLAEACQDGVRKKAKYLHDAPPEALRPVLGPNYNPAAAVSVRNGHRHPSNAGSDAGSSVGTFYSQSTQYPVFSSAATQLGSIPENLPFPQQSPVSPTFQASGNPQLGSIAVNSVSSPMNSFPPALFDPSNPAIFNFNLEGLNFGSQYGAMEFGMLGHMSSGAAETPPRDPSIAQQGTSDVGFNPSGVFGNSLNQFEKVYDNNTGLISDFLTLDAHSNGLYSQGNLQHGLPHAYAIPAGPTSLQSPSTENNSPQPTGFGFESPTTTNYTGVPGAAGNQPGSQQPRAQKPKTPALGKLGPQSVLGKRQRDPSSIYEAVKEPFQYVASFHKLISLLQNRFSGASTISIVRSLASIRPSFMSCMKTLNRADLIFMEKSFQRALFEHEEFMHQSPSPAIACRRTGEIAAVNKEFTALTGWTKDVLLGKTLNLNANMGGTNSDTLSISSKGGRGGIVGTTPRLKPLHPEQGTNADSQQQQSQQHKEQPQPVFLAELMDEASVTQFYEDYAQLAFTHSRGTVVRKCRLLKYRTQENMDAAAAAAAAASAPTASGGSGSSNGTVVNGGPDSSPAGKTEKERPTGVNVASNSILSNRVAKIDGEHGISKLERDGKLECSYTWTIKRDVFDIPMIIMINFLPCYYRSHNQLAV
ncbi:hypothetical protein NEUTE1DRAFT_69322 [Neurospora tetrasperma FGSC 2508]|uniref:Zn(2)-C6 fungal-type domain-containing protein n=1 Tax=Neurospora tetrasperma (strain FGSC 2508 / ATCC MYA-4615 / P0657) TaxID=510951 RepID=F8MUS8_NEUT8|nr:uncharacterized protein NEUTE1DRAFT_69322 [Neurospora tetrasperma FGSC 2508]EGO54553.1 hypothetical protein NEUTE1DRAFT_69322 [Neurospora tetrasperma FGSC 2508]EGZ67994.1 hypothetical protein NEUTE2DRAFT_160447 [Neurospora tetrasperma FGSC 2509]